VGFLSLEPFRLLVNDKRMHSIPLILETPAPEKDTWATEIQMLYWMVGKKADDLEIFTRARELQQKGEEDRRKQTESLLRKDKKIAEAKVKQARRRKFVLERRKDASESEGESEGGSDPGESGESDDDKGHGH